MFPNPTDLYSFSKSCRHCMCPVKILYGPDGHYRLHAWTCPHCGGVNGLSLSGAIGRVVKDGPQDTDIEHFCSRSLAIGDVVPEKGAIIRMSKCFTCRRYAKLVYDPIRRQPTGTVVWSCPYADCAHSQPNFDIFNRELIAVVAEAGEEQQPSVH